MERFDFTSAMAVLMEHMNKERYGSQVDLMYLLFDDFAENAPFIFDNGLVNRWLKGKDRLSPHTMQTGSTSMPFALPLNRISCP